ncbi:MAG: ribosomal protein L7/L12 [Planctomycetota bacterium]
MRPILAQDGKIAAIKAYRERTGVGLRDAKLAIERLGC